MVSEDSQDSEVCVARRLRTERLRQQSHQRMRRDCELLVEASFPYHRTVSGWSRVLGGDAMSLAGTKGRAKRGAIGARTAAAGAYAGDVAGIIEVRWRRLRA